MKYQYICHIYLRIIGKIWTGKNDSHNALTTAQIVVPIWSIVLVRSNLVVLAKQFNLKEFTFLNMKKLKNKYLYEIVYNISYGFYLMER